MSRALERDPEINIQSIELETRLPLDRPIPLGGENPPPEFTVYEPEYSKSASNGNVVSHDKHLNEDGEALYRFLLSQGQIFPDHRIRCHGTHTETRTRTHQVADGRGGWTTRTTTETVTVTDFIFSFDLTQYIVAGPLYWTAVDTEPVYRGLMVREVGVDPTTTTTTTTTTGAGTRKATAEERDGFDDWNERRIGYGMPPWTESEYRTTLANQSCRPLRQWADEYCASNKYLKEFIFKKEVYGWDRGYVQAAVKAIIRETGYSHSIDVDFVTSSTKVYIRPDNELSRSLSNCCVRFLCCLFCIYPIIWLFKRFHSRGGGRWKVGGCAYTLKYWQQVDHPDGSGASMHPVGYKERDWVERYADIIRSAVLRRVQESNPLC